MTYCVAIRLHAGMVFLSDSRTNAGVDQIGLCRKMHVFERPGDRLIVMMTAGNLSISQSIRHVINQHVNAHGKTIWSVDSMYEAAEIVREAIRTVHAQEAKSLEGFGLHFNVGVILGGQIGNERSRLFYFYSAGNFIESHHENPYFQIGEAKYGKPILDRVITPSTSLDDGAKCALISMDSTLRSNISVGLPLELLVYETGSLRMTRFATLDEHNPYFQELRNNWGKQLKTVFESIAPPLWQPVSAGPDIKEHETTPPDTMMQRPIRMRPPSTQVEASRKLQQDQVDVGDASDQEGVIAP